MRIGIIGTGYVGLVTGVGFALKGHQVTGLDTNMEKVNLINSKKPPFFEPGLQEALEQVVPDRFSVVAGYRELVGKSEVIFVCVDTPTLANGEQDLSSVESACASLGKELAGSGFKLIVVKSTVLPGTTNTLVVNILEKNSGKKAGKDFGVAFNPEFLQEGNALNDILYPDRVVIGVTEEKSEKILFQLYGEFGGPIQVTSTIAAEMIKYASNCFLPTKISFINEIGALCKKLGIDTYEVAKGIGMDKRIGPAFMRSGLGWG
ncbi:UDP-glucose/GDP-mannose dehydrogenase family protein, partial [Candidatus Micrarchaeota archaeon]|nr:UDP-glucose/GDP-mannose dehydrogenase family protein [Candidatus Micrarchaeota archaeon]